MRIVLICGLGRLIALRKDAGLSMTNVVSPGLHDCQG